MRRAHDCKVSRHPIRPIADRNFGSMLIEQCRCGRWKTSCASGRRPPKQQLSTHRRKTQACVIKLGGQLQLFISGHMTHCTCLSMFFLNWCGWWNVGAAVFMEHISCFTFSLLHAGSEAVALVLLSEVDTYRRCLPQLKSCVRGYGWEDSHWAALFGYLGLRTSGEQPMTFSEAACAVWAAERSLWPPCPMTGCLRACQHRSLRALCSAGAASST